MFLKQKIIKALDRYEDIEVDSKELLGATNKRAEGITQGAFVAWFREQDDNKKYAYQTVGKCIDDCVEDGYINRTYVDGHPYRAMEHTEGELGGIALKASNVKYTKIENISVSSKGRDLKEWYFFLPAILEKMSAKDLAFFAVTTGVTIVLGYLGIKNL